MICDTVRTGKDCTFIKKSGCSYIAKTCFPIVEEKCTECKNVESFNEKKYCKSYMNPELTWKTGCGLNTARILTKEEVKKINPLKASKQASKGKKKK